jgi:3-methyladenine DNA glycosylase AlkD
MGRRRQVTSSTRIGLQLDAQTAQQRLRSLADPEVAAVSARFFKTGPGQYGEGDRFIGIKSPTLKTAAKEFNRLPLAEIEILLRSEVHEDRTLALVILVIQFEKGDDDARKRIYNLYVANTQHINNWDLVDISAPQIVGGYLEERSRKPLYRMAKSSSLWERRISIVATHWFIRDGDFDDTLKISETLLRDEEDLIHKAVGWMLREVGKRNVATLEAFLGEQCRSMPRTTLRYAIERFSEEKRREYLKGTIPDRESP